MDKNKLKMYMFNDTWITCTVLSIVSAWIKLIAGNADCPPKPDPCTSHTKLNGALDHTRSSKFYNAEMDYYSDSNILEGWYHANAGAGDDMPTKAPGNTYCQAYFPIWLQGTLPSPGDGLVQRKACVGSTTSNCSYNLSICIKTCNVNGQAYNVYWLPRPTDVYSRYCFGSLLPCPYPKQGFGPPCSVLHDISSPGLKGPQFTKYSPSYGPADGGTIITIVGDLDPNTVNLTKLKNIPQDSGTGARGISNNISIDCQIIRSNDQRDKNLYIKTLPAANPKFIGLKFVIHITVFASEQREQMTEYNTGFIFVYKQNPDITEISPKNVFLKGGINITASGQHLDSVADPVMFINMEKRLYNNEDNNYQILDTVAFRSQHTYVHNSTVLIGVTPEINISMTSLGQGNLPSSRRKRQNNDLNIPVNSEGIEFFVGFELDGVETFLNLSEAIDPEAGRIVLFYNPAIHSFEEVKKYDSKLNLPIEFTGERLNLGAKMKDYMVAIGDSKCKVIELTENQMFCKPPEKEPKVIKHVRSMKGKPSISVTVGYFKFNVGHIDYVHVGDDTTLYIIIGVVAVVVLVAVIALTAIICSRKSNNSE